MHHVTYSAKKFEIASSNGLGIDTFTRITLLDLGIKVTRNVAKYSLHQLTY